MLNVSPARDDNTFLVRDLLTQDLVYTMGKAAAHSTQHLLSDRKLFKHKLVPLAPAISCPPDHSTHAAMSKLLAFVSLSSI